ncbi:MAG: hypothetical protein J6S19_06050 [Lentisphaeria bacterium]|nr:hypothetical protein [Lentisphaeria bacterium]
MKKIRLTVITLSVMLLTAIITNGCASTGYYQDQAVQSARAFLLEEMPEIPLMEQEYIKFNRPFMLASQLSGNYSTGTAQICVCWMTPGNPDVYMVYGTSSMRMNDWHPVRVIRKNFKNPQQLYLTLAARASSELIQQQYGLLSAASLNHIRFTLPGVWKCNIPLDSNPDTEITPEALAKAEKLPRYVLAWELVENGKKIYSVWGGTAVNDKLEGFRMYFSGLYPEENFQAALIGTAPLTAPYGGDK